MRVTHTYALMEVSDSTFNEIEGKLREAGQDYAGMLEEEITAEGKKTNGIAMQGIMLVRKPPEQRRADSPEQRTIVDTLESMGIPKDLIGDGSGVTLPDINTQPKDMLETGVMCPGFADPQVNSVAVSARSLIPPPTDEPFGGGQIESVIIDDPLNQVADDTSFALSK